MERDLSLADRKVDTKLGKIVVVFDIDEIDRHFQESVALIQKQLDHIDDIAILDVCIAEEVLRSQIVALDSAFDFYLHEVIKLGIVEMYCGTWIVSSTEKYKNLSFRMSFLETAVAEQKGSDWLKKWVDDEWIKGAYMSYSAFKAVCNLIGIKVKDISNVFYQRGCKKKTTDQLQNAIDKLFRHRNRIAHQSDRKSRNAVRHTISKEDVEKYIYNIRRIVAGMTAQILYAKVFSPT